MMKYTVDRRRMPAYLLYVFLWLFFLVIPVITNNYGDQGRYTRIYYDWLRMSPFFLVFIINNLVLLPFILFRGHTRAYLFSLLLSVLFITSAFQAAGPGLFRNDPELLERRILQDPQYGREEMNPGAQAGEVPGQTEIFKAPPTSGIGRSVSPYKSVFQFINTFLISLLVAGFNTAIAMTNRWLTEEQARKDAEKEQVKSELAFLQNQISPHFFMNTLNNIHALIDTDREMAQDSILKLSALMRYLLYESGRGTTTLRKETDFLRSYVNLMQLRFDKGVKISLDLPDEISDINIPPLLFISFIENAFKHGVSYREPSSISFGVRQYHDRLEFISVNTIPSFTTESAKVHGGIGLDNIRKRLDLLYGKNYQLRIDRDGNEFRVHLVLPL